MWYYIVKDYCMSQFTFQFPLPSKWLVVTISHSQPKKGRNASVRALDWWKCGTLSPSVLSAEDLPALRKPRNFFQCPLSSSAQLLLAAQLDTISDWERVVVSQSPSFSKLNSLLWRPDNLEFQSMSAEWTRASSQLIAMLPDWMIIWAKLLSSKRMPPKKKSKKPSRFKMSNSKCPSQLFRPPGLRTSLRWMSMPRCRSWED